MKKVTQFEASDGKRFEDKREAERHEAFLSFKADLTAGLDAGNPADKVASDLWTNHFQVAPKAKPKTADAKGSAGDGSAKGQDSDKNAPASKPAQLSLAS